MAKKNKWPSSGKKKPMSRTDSIRMKADEEYMEDEYVTYDDDAAVRRASSLPGALAVGCL